jgi:P pilus assembly chaperone PapD
MFFSLPAMLRISGSSIHSMILTRTMRHHWHLLLGLCLLLPQHHALADLMLHPTRIVFEKNQRAAQLELVNNGTEAATYRISLVNRRMSDTGQFSAVDSPVPGELFSDGLLRYSPRQITLAPGAGQVVRIMLRKPASLAPGEYRSHLQFERLPEAKGANSIETRRSADQEIGVELKVLIGASIPVIVRHGETAATVNLSHLELQQPASGQPPVLALQLNRSGNQSVYGDLTVSFIPQGGDEQIMAKIGGVAVYTPNDLRRAKIALQPPAGLTLGPGTVRVTYREPPDAGGKLLAEASIALP